MTPEQKIKWLILLKQAELEETATPQNVTAENVDELYYNMYDRQDATNEVRNGDVNTPQIYCEYSRHYETKSVASQLPDGSWVGWVYWYGGGKHGEPESCPWMEHAYVLDCFEEEKLVVVQTFKRKAI